VIGRANVVAAAAGLVAGLIATGPSPAKANAVEIDVRLGQSVIHTSKTDRIYLKLNLKALARKKSEERVPLNVALVLDRSGSMQGARIVAAKEAAKMAIDRLGSEDIVSLVTYNHGVEVVQPAARLTSHRDLKQKIDEIKVDGRTALYAGVKEGATQVRGKLSPHRVNRVILLSDGLANVGPATPRELADLGRELAREGISVTTIGLGLDYNEDLMQRLAAASDGNHAFVEKPESLVKIFNSEFGDALSVAAQDVIITIECRPGFKPVKVMGRTAEIEGNSVKLRLGQLTSMQDRSVVLELEVAKGQSTGEADIANVDVVYTDLDLKERKDTKSIARGRISSSDEEAEASVDKSVMAEVTTQIATERNEQAVELRDKGDVAGARKVLEMNASYLKQRAQELSSGLAAAPAPATRKLMELEKSNRSAAESLDQDKWDKTRKIMREDQHRSKVQQSY